MCYEVALKEPPVCTPIRYLSSEWVHFFYQIKNLLIANIEIDKSGLYLYNRNNLLYCRNNMFYRFRARAFGYLTGDKTNNLGRARILFAGFCRRDKETGRALCDILLLYGVV